MKKRIMVISLGGSIIVPEKINFTFLKNFKHVLRKNYKNYHFIVVCGGGSIARKYIELLKREGISSERELSTAGIRVTRMNALTMMELFGKEANDNLPTNMHEVRNNIHKNKVVFCGALRWEDKSTSDGTAAKLAHDLKGEFINMTNVKGLFSDNPLTNPKARFIPYETWKQFEKRALGIKFKSGQHFVLDQKAAVLIRKYKIKTYIIGENAKNLNNLLKGKKFIGTLIEG